MEITVKQMMEIENNGHQMGFLKKFMMENAGAAAVKRLSEKFDLANKSVKILAGLGNNGGDSLVMARHLAGYNAKVFLYLLGDPSKLKTDESQWNWSLLEKMESVSVVTGGEINQEQDCDIIVDGILGTGIIGDIREPYSSAIDFINSSKGFKLAVDVPSGMNPDTGGTANKVAKADMTVTFHKLKTGMRNRKDLCGEIFVEKIGIPPEAEQGVL
ncbi:MAG: NAD(P)H-hydrate epimerase [Nitrosopumilaceae archaeon]|nr:NAD(P)H-hydrate epimerase [Nitrosopumilaceae archaeon]NIU00504.1 NAD(P)H-hydrate epimerase [Nitrosopumilaceae archaeon]NIU86887.1 NAD(P)H-hydrate epimerase [Nitrosopumilaceae archaeon]NIV65567.1 NAD(P)H-hydrate epimerase [Nitrosopumilaceae archaeon]NIX61106.1 NAD(P)H-hydrate epimerase [Nitrosopumilaceae archaeon]